MAARIEINPVGNFDVHGDKLGQTWQRWHRSFELYATGKVVTDEKQKKAVIDIFQLPGLSVVHLG
jgi:hypothetical protein